MKHKDWARSPPTTRNIPELGISECIPLTEYIPFRVFSSQCEIRIFPQVENSDRIHISVGSRNFQSELADTENCEV